jgi:hypothetical protein
MEFRERHTGWESNPGTPLKDRNLLFVLRNAQAAYNAKGPLRLRGADSHDATPQAGRFD